MSPNSRRIDEQAAHWAVRLAAGDLPAQDLHELRQWLDLDSRHRGALLNAQSVWGDLERFNALSGPVTTRSAPQPHQAPYRLRSFTRWIAAATVVLGVAGSSWYAYRAAYLTGERYTTPIGGTQSVPLQDGSQVTLNTASSLRVELTPTQRHVELQQGEAFFDVASDKNRPFVVQAGTRRVVVIGTQFSVRRDHDQLEVMVTEGKVRVEGQATPGPGPVASPILLESGASAQIDSRGHLFLAKLAPVAVQRRLAWRVGDVDFNGESLEEAVTEINRHNRRHIVIDDPALAQRPVIGTFTANDPEAFATTVAAALEALKVDSPDTIHLRRNAP